MSAEDGAAVTGLEDLTDGEFRALLANVQVLPEDLFTVGARLRVAIEWLRRAEAAPDPGCGNRCRHCGGKDPYGAAERRRELLG